MKWKAFGVLTLAIIAFAAGLKLHNAIHDLRRPAYYVPSGYKWGFRHAAMIERAHAGNINAIFLGDSIVDGWSDHLSWERDWVPLRAVDFGLSGDSSEIVLSRVRDGTLDGSGAKVVVLLIGTNDLAAGETPDRLARNIGRIVDEATSRLPGVHVVLLGLLPRGPENDALRQPIAETNRLLAKMDGVRFVDLGDVPLSDGLHPSPAGYEAMTQKLLPVIRDLIAR